jgi:hypothetical protein
MSITATFVKAFDASNETHVLWLSHMMDIAENMNNPEKHVDLVTEINKNPMKVKLAQQDALDWAHIHFCVSAVYAKAVLKGKAFIPRREDQ